MIANPWIAPPNRRFTIARRRIARLAIARLCSACALAGAAALALSSAGCAQLRVGEGVSIVVREAPGRQIVADEIELLPETRSLSLRAPIQNLDLAAGRMRLLHLDLVLDPAETVVDDGGPGAGFDRLREGAQVEVKIRPRDGLLIASEVRTKEIKASIKIKGTVSEIVPAIAGAYLATLDQVDILIMRSTEFTQEVEDALLSDLFGEQKSDEDLGDDPAYHLRWGDDFFVSGSVRSAGRLEQGFSLGASRDDRVGIGEPSFRLEALRVLSRTARVFAQATTRGSYELYRAPGAAGDVVEDGAQLQLRQLYVAWQDIGGAPLGVLVGKQRLRDPREFLFDEYLDGVRLYVYPVRPLVLEATALLPLVPLKSRFESWRDLLLQTRLYVGDWQARAYALQRFDSDVDRRRDVRFLGLAVDGEQGPLKAWAEGTLLRGEDKGRLQQGVAWDVGASLRSRRAPLAPSITIAAARGSGPSGTDDGTNSEFRQTGYQDNSTRLWGIASFKRYGEALDPELTNIRVYSIGAGLQPHDRLSIDVLGHRYVQDHLSNQLDHTDLPSPQAGLNGRDLEVGHGVDLITGIGNLIGGLDLSYRVGTFLPGLAFDRDTGPVFVHRLELRLDF